MKKALKTDKNKHFLLAQALRYMADVNQGRRVGQDDRGGAVGDFAGCREAFINHLGG